MERYDVMNICLFVCLAVGLASAVRHGEVSKVPGYLKIVCEGRTLRLDCSDKCDNQEGCVIKITSAVYGRQNRDTCLQWEDDDPPSWANNWNTACKSQTSLAVVQNACDLTHTCSLDVNNKNFGDPCPNIGKYLQATYQCVQADSADTVPPVEADPGDLSLRDDLIRPDFLAAFTQAATGAPANATGIPTSTVTPSITATETSSTLGTVSSTSLPTTDTTVSTETHITEEPTTSTEITDSSASTTTTSSTTTSTLTIESVMGEEVGEDWGVSPPSTPDVWLSPGLVKKTTRAPVDVKPPPTATEWVPPGLAKKTTRGAAWSGRPRPGNSGNAPGHNKRVTQSQTVSDTTEVPDVETTGVDEGGLVDASTTTIPTPSTSETRNPESTTSPEIVITSEEAVSTTETLRVSSSVGAVIDEGGLVAPLPPGYATPTTTTPRPETSTTRRPTTIPPPPETTSDAPETTPTPPRTPLSSATSQLSPVGSTDETTESSSGISWNPSPTPVADPLPSVTPRGGGLDPGEGSAWDKKSTPTTTHSTTPSTISITSSTTTPTEPSTTFPSSSEAPVTSSVTTSVTTEERGPTKEPARLLCPETTARGIIWPLTQGGLILYRPCPGLDENAQASWRCQKNGTWLGQPDVRQCLSAPVKEAEKEIEDPGTPVENATQALVAATENVATAPDLVTVTQVMQKAAERLERDLRNETLSPAQKKIKASRVTEDLAESSSNLLDESQEATWQQLNGDEKKQSAEEVLTSMEECVEALGATLQQQPGQVVPVVGTRRNVAYEVRRVPVDREARLPEALTQPASEAVVIPPQVLQLAAGGNTTVAVSAIFYTSIERYLASDKEDLRLNTRLLSVSLSRAVTRTFSEPVKLIFALRDRNMSGEPQCSFWEFSEDVRRDAGAWSGAGCHVAERNHSHVTCSCDHLTNFAVLMNTADVEFGETHDRVLTIITYCGLAVSLVCLLLAFLTFTCLRGLQSDRNTIHKNLVACLFVAELIFLLAITLTESKVGCRVIAAVMHYMFLAAFTWMLAEGVHLYFMLIKVFDTGRSLAKYYYLMGYGIPLVIVGVSVGVSGGVYSWRGYGVEGEHCWLSTEHGFIWSFVAPVAVILFLNLVMLTVALYMMCQHSRTSAHMRATGKSKSTQIKGYLQGAWVLVLLLGLTWTFGFLFMHGDTGAATAFAYIFTILNCLQGLFIFCFYCLRNDKVKKEYRKWVRRSTWIPDRIRIAILGKAGLYDVSSSQPKSTSSKNQLFKFKMKKSSSSNTTRGTSAPGSNKGTPGKYKSCKYDAVGNGKSGGSSGVYSMSSNGRPGAQGARDAGDAVDLSQMDCSVVDSDMVSEACRHNFTVQMDMARDAERKKERERKAGKLAPQPEFEELEVSYNFDSCFDSEAPPPAAEGEAGVERPNHVPVAVRVADIEEKPLLAPNGTSEVPRGRLDSGLGSPRQDKSDVVVAMNFDPEGVD